MSSKLSKQLAQQDHQNWTLWLMAAFEDLRHSQMAVGILDYDKSLACVAWAKYSHLTSHERA